MYIAAYGKNINLAYIKYAHAASILKRNKLQTFCSSLVYIQTDYLKEIIQVRNDKDIYRDLCLYLTIHFADLFEHGRGTCSLGVLQHLQRM